MAQYRIYGKGKRPGTKVYATLKEAKAAAKKRRGVTLIEQRVYSKKSAKLGPGRGWWSRTIECRRKSGRYVCKRYGS